VIVEIKEEKGAIQRIKCRNNALEQKDAIVFRG